MKKQLTVALVIGFVVVLLVSGCATTPSEDKSSKDDSKSIRVSGDIIETAVIRNGF